ncbi:MAG: glycoside hydrolase family 3 C-terminal domain-containing protein [Lachnospiraceae bacterium]|nr:glycoside hydrolase family 3 C-terminal domain-containing protein [Lachnospiraceae bacterium]
MNKWSRIKFTPNLPLGANGERVTGSKAHIELSKEAAKEGMVLLKNENNVLPLSAGSKVALFGKGTFDYVKGGGGSGDVTVAYTRNLYEGLSLQKDKISIFEELCDYYRKDIEEQYKNGNVPGMTIEPDVPNELLQKAKAYTDTAIITICRYSGEGWDRKSVIDPNNKALWDYERKMTEKSAEIFKDGDFCLSVKEKEMVDAVKTNFKNVIVILNVGGMVDTSWFAYDPKIQSALLALQGGMEGGLAAAELLVGDGNPSGKTVDTFARTLDDYPSTHNFHESRDYVDYTDDIYVGYRYFETIPGAAEKVVYPFGYGLSYTTFNVETVSAGILQPSHTANSQSAPHDAVSHTDTLYVRVRVTNTGKRAGKEVVQVYAAKPQGKLGKPAKELVAFEKTRELLSGESQIMTLTWSINDMASYDDLGKIQKSAYVLEAGSYDIYVGTSVRDVQKADYSYILDEDIITEQLSAKLVPTSLAKRMLSDGSFEELPQSEPVDTDASVVGNIDPSLTEGVAPGQRAIPYFRFADGMVKNGKYDIMDVVEGQISLDEFISELSVDDLIHLLGGQPNIGAANTFGIGNMPEYGIPSVMTADGPAGVRINPEVGVCTTAFPCSTLLACTWNPDIVEAVGHAGGKELKENNLGLWLTPAINIHRSPLCGRNFEYYSEDPFVTGKLAGAMVRGIQSNNVGATLKHFALNNKETNRKNSDSRVSERAAREIYLKAFEMIVKAENPWAVMSSYNIINGYRASENKDLLTGILRDEWGYTGMVTTDWWTCGEHYKETKAGNDLKMGNGYPKRVKEAYEKGAISRDEIEICVKRILNFILKLD